MSQEYEIVNGKIVFEQRPLFKLSGEEIIALLATADILADKAKDHDEISAKMLILTASRIEDQAMTELIFRN